ncbi:cystathionine beta-lyase [Pusillimonas sp. T7-7]|uniref:trans-sulfuration enzyme family protein n=1 Tax=Alcaligenaceae TaxID=506 RepID=UPI00020844AB|nr:MULTISPECIES: PLP-dependent transferase [Alcaligenaceae]AEC20338.1 cystathionine beta-lyase [Pusillimonas sp. T7-7]MCC2597771.1 PLP-dependent transferase [Pusillimonas sp. MFBS29]
MEVISYSYKTILRFMKNATAAHLAVQRKYLTGFSSLSPAVWRASTITFSSLDEFVARKSRLPDGYTYGTTGTPTHRELEARIAALDKASHCVVLPSGQAAISLVMLTMLKAGDHLLITDSAYGPAHDFATHLTHMGVEVERYDPCIGSGIADLIRSNTQLIWLESPGTVTMEVQDVPAIVSQARSHGIRTAIDNSWASSLYFSPLSLGVDLCIQACSKHMGGHSDLLMGSVSTNDIALHTALRALQATMGQAVSAEDCFLVQRGLDTMTLRLEAQSVKALRLAEHLQRHPMVREVLHPALSTFKTHSLWQDQFSGSGSLFSLVLQDAPLDAFRAMFGSFRHIAIGASYGGLHSLAAFYHAQQQTSRLFPSIQAPIIRLAIGLEDYSVLATELNQSLETFESVCIDSAKSGAK